ncbi:hypothetical protein HDU76_010187 [Blyttiomyces sp. JEL0837]|nr:hypothetical protein HDU76_010187 [Blyttiomyces sp. JEL0837]
MASFGARIDKPKELLHTNILYEYRGANFATGGDNDSLSVGAQVRAFNPKLRGLSYGDRVFDFCYGPICAARTLIPDNVPVQGLNAAESGAWVSNWQPQLSYFHDHLSEVDPLYKTSPKLMILELGYNDLCLGCFNWTQKLEFEADKFEGHLRDMLTALRSSIPNLLVLIMPTFHLSELHSVFIKDDYCKIARTVLAVECICLLETTDFLTGSWAKMDQLADQYAQRARKVSAEFNALKDPSFAILYDNGMNGLNITNGDISLLSKEDCFHPSKKAHDLFATNLWNNLFTPYAQKAPYTLYSTDVVCPTEDDRIIVDYNFN